MRKSGISIHFSKYSITTKYEEFVIKQFNYDVPQGVIRIVDMLT